jgi:hypothetical protein
MPPLAQELAATKAELVTKMEEVAEAGAAGLAAARKELDDRLNMEIGEVGGSVCVNFDTSQQGITKVKSHQRNGRS